MRLFFLPADAPIWLRLVVYSIRDGLSDVWNTAIRLKDYATASLPPAADWKQGLVYDSTLPAVKYSDGTNWQRLMVHNGGAALTRTDDTNVTVTLGGSPTTALLAAASLTMGWSGTLALTRGGTGAANAADARTNLGLGTAAVKNTGVSGDAVPVLNGAATTWAAGATFGGSISVTGSATATTYLRAQGNLPGALTGAGPYLYYTSGVGIFENYNWGTSAYEPFRLNGSEIEFHLSGASKATLNTAAFNIASGLVFQIASTQVVGARKTGWGTATGTATRTTFDTTTVTTQQLAERVKALIDDLHGTAGHGLIGT